MHTSDENKEKYQLGIISWSNSKFSKVAPWELYGRQWWELQLVIQYNTISITYQYNMTHTSDKN